MSAHTTLLALGISLTLVSCYDGKNGAGASQTAADDGSGGDDADTVSADDASASADDANSASADDASASASADGADDGPGSSDTADGGDDSGSASVDSGSADGDASTGDGGDDSVQQLCVDTINMYRGTLGLPAYERWVDAEVCSDGEAESDSQTMQPHGAFGSCGESAQNECPGWPAPPEGMIESCLAAMWAEGPGEDFQAHGHYINMSSTSYSRVACGFFTTGSGDVWAVQNFQ
jgi:hypothetical protein